MNVFRKVCNTHDFSILFHKSECVFPDLTCPFYPLILAAAEAWNRRAMHRALFVLPAELQRGRPQRWQCEPIGVGC